MPSVEPRYAEALLSAAENPFQAAKTGEALRDFCDAMDAAPELRMFMLNPASPPPAKKDVVKQILSEDAPGFAFKFLCLLIDKNRLEHLSKILAEYEYMAAKSRGAIIIEVTSAQPLTERERAEISETYRKKYGAKEARVNERVDSSLLGGIKVQVGDDLVDGSLSGRLSGLASAIS